MVSRVVIGKREDGTYGLDISIPGKDVLTATGSDLAFSSKWSGTFLVHQSGVAQNGVDVTFPALPFVPIVLGSVDANNSTGDDYTSFLGRTFTQSDGNRLTGHYPAIRVWNNKFFIESRGFVNTTYRYLILRVKGGD